MTQVEKMARFAANARFDKLQPAQVDRLKVHVLDTIGCALGALNGEPILKMRRMVDEEGGSPSCTLIGGGKTSSSNATLYNTSLTRYLDFMDNFMTEGETCHPCDNIAALLVAGELANASGKQFLTGMAVAYQVECRLSEVAPVMDAGLDHTYDLSFSIPCGAAHILGANLDVTSNALAMSGAYLGSVAVIRSSPGTEFKGLAAAVTAAGSINALMMAKHGITGPLGVIENKKGTKEILKVHIDVEWEKEPLNVIERCSLKSYNAEVHTQSTVDAVLALRDKYSLNAADIDVIKIEVFKTAYEITGGGEYGNRYLVERKEQADHSLPYLVAVAILDGKVWPDQFARERIRRKDVQDLLKRVYVAVPEPKEEEQLIRQTDPFTEKYPKEVCCRVTIRMKNGEELVEERNDFPGFFTKPFTWDQAYEKYHRLASSEVDSSLVDEIGAAIKQLESIQMWDLTALLAKAGEPSPVKRAKMI